MAAINAPHLTIDENFLAFTQIRVSQPIADECPNKHRRRGGWDAHQAAPTDGGRADVKGDPVPKIPMRVDITNRVELLIECPAPQIALRIKL